MGDVVDHGRQGLGRAHGNPEDHVADVADEREGEHALDVDLGQRTQDAHEHGQQGHPHQQPVDLPVREQQGLGADDRVDAHLGQQPREHRRHRRGGRGVGVGEPEGQREHRGLDPERDQQHEVQLQLRALREVGELHGEVRHVHGAGGAVDHPQGDEEQDRGDHRDHHVGHARPDALRGPSHGEQHVGGRQEDLEAHVEVEQVPRQERVGDTGHEQQERGVEDRDGALVVPAGHALAHRVDEHREGHDHRHHEHERGELVHHHDDPVRGRPATQVHGLGALVPHVREHDGVQDQRQCHGSHGHGALEPVAVHDHEVQSRTEERDEHRERCQLRQVSAHADPSCPCAAASRPCGGPVTPRPPRRCGARA